MELFLGRWRKSLRVIRGDASDGMSILKRFASVWRCVLPRTDLEDGSEVSMDRHNPHSRRYGSKGM